jgi:hypothetical protein
MKPRKATDLYAMNFTLYANGVLIPDASGSSFTLTMRNRATGIVKFTGAMTIVSAPLAQVRYTPIAGDVDTPGSYQVEIKQVRPDGTPRHFPSDGYEAIEIEETLA